jgi:hypothetical protein
MVPRRESRRATRGEAPTVVATAPLTTAQWGREGGRRRSEWGGGGEGDDGSAPHARRRPSGWEERSGLPLTCGVHQALPVEGDVDEEPRGGGAEEREAVLPEDSEGRAQREDPGRGDPTPHTDGERGGPGEVGVRGGGGKEGVGGNGDGARGGCCQRRGRLRVAVPVPVLAARGCQLPRLGLLVDAALGHVVAEVERREVHEAPEGEREAPGGVELPRPAKGAQRRDDRVVDDGGGELAPPLHREDGEDGAPARHLGARLGRDGGGERVLAANAEAEDCAPDCELDVDVVHRGGGQAGLGPEERKGTEDPGRAVVDRGAGRGGGAAEGAEDDEQGGEEEVGLAAEEVAEKAEEDLAEDAADEGGVVDAVLEVARLGLVERQELVREDGVGVGRKAPPAPVGGVRVDHRHAVEAIGVGRGRVAEGGEVVGVGVGGAVDVDVLGER